MMIGNVTFEAHVFSVFSIGKHIRVRAPATPLANPKVHQNSRFQMLEFNPSLELALTTTKL